MSINKKDILSLHTKTIGKLTISSTIPINSMEVLSKVYSPGVGEVVKEIEQNPEEIKKYTIAGKTVAVISNGTAVLGYGDVGARAALPVMEGKCAIFKEFAGIDAFPICIDEKDPNKFIEIVKSFGFNFAGINLEDISAPNCFYIEEKLQEALDIPIVHDDQHGTAIVTLASLMGALELRVLEVKYDSNKTKKKIIIIGAGAAGLATTKLLIEAQKEGLIPPFEIGVIDSKGLVSLDREDLNPYKLEIAQITNQTKFVSMEEYIHDSLVFIGLSKGGLLTPELMSTMSPSPIIFALANPIPEIMPEIALENGAFVVATGRSDYPNQINNALAYPGLFKGAIKNGINKIEVKHKLKVAKAIYKYHHKNLSKDSILPAILDKKVVDLISEELKQV